MELMPDFICAYVTQRTDRHGQSAYLDKKIIAIGYP